MSKIDDAIYEIDSVICKNITHLCDTDRGLLSQNILSQLRNFVEAIAIKEYCKEAELSPNSYETIKKAIYYIKTRSNLQFLSKFHKLLQESVSHYTANSDGSERLMLKYYEYLLRIKSHLYDNYNMTVLSNLNEFPINTDQELSEYYAKIAQRIDVPSSNCKLIQNTDRYYVHKIKPFFVGEKIYYEVTITNAYSTSSKFDRFIAFTSCDIIDNYSVKFNFQKDFISILGKEMEIMVIKDYEVSIRPCEWDNFLKITGVSIQKQGTLNEYRSLMAFIYNSGMSLTELVCNDEQYYAEIKKQIINYGKSTAVFDLFDHCRDIIINEKPGANILRYLLYKMNNSVLKRQYSGDICKPLSNLHLDYRCIPFDEMPYCSSLRQHNLNFVI